jgi:hypothetical protein
MKASQTAVEALKNTPVIRTAGDARAVLSNVLLALVRKEISATDATAAVAVTDGMCNLLNSEIKAARLTLEMRKAAGKAVALVELGQTLINGEKNGEET